MRGRQAADAGIDGVRIGDVAEGEEILDRRRVDPPGEFGQGQQAAELGGEGESAIRQQRVMQRLLAQPVARQQQLAAVAVVEGEGEHAGKPLDAIGAPLLPGVQNGLGVRAGAIAMAELLQLGAHRLVIVDLAVEADDDGAALIGHRLMAASQIDDRQPAMAEGEMRLEMEAVPVRPAMRHGIGHPANPPGIRDPRIQRMKQAGYAAHEKHSPVAPAGRLASMMRLHS